MNSVESNENVCRICLEDEAVTNWNEEIVEFSGISYKDCYYKYTDLLASDLDPLPQNVCEICSKELRNAHLLFEKAVRSYKILQASLTFKEFQPQPIFPKEEAELEISNFDDDCKPTVIFEVQTLTEDEKLIDIEKEIYPINEYDNESLISAENATNNTKAKTNKVERPEARHHSGIKRELSVDDLLKEEASERCDTKIKKVKRVKKRYLCSHCPSTSCSMNALRKHEATHSENRERTHKCQQCGVTFYTKTTLNNHMKIHDKNREKKYKCEFCDKAFFNRGACNVHRRKHLGQMIACPICSREFYRQVDLDHHLPKHSVEPLQKITEKLKYKVKCQLCNKSVDTRFWKEHKVLHLGQPQMKCKICEKDFFARKKCIKHLNRLHHKTRNDYDLYIHYYGDGKNRTSHLMTKQQEIVQTVVKQIHT